MNLLVCGAGIQGQYLSAHLHNFGAEVSLLTRGQKTNRLRENGVCYQVYPDDKIHHVQVPIVTKIGDDYDIILVTMQKQQAMAFSTDLGLMRGEATVVFLGNNGTGIKDYRNAVPADSLVLGFLLMAGYHKASCMQVIADERLEITIGALTDEAAPRLREVIGEIEGNNMAVNVPSDIDAWLKSHLAVVLPLVGGIYGANCDNYHLSKTPALLKLMAKGLKETYKVVRECGYPFLPRRLVLMTKLPDILLVRLLKKRLASTESTISLAGHARAAHSEMQHLANEFQHLVDESKLNTPNYDRLMQFLDPTTSPIDIGVETLD